MDEVTVRRLNAINRQFYVTVADDFDATRGQAWVGWEKLIEHLQPHPPTPSPGGEGEISVLDVGCGNGRFGVFLRDKLGAIRYHGMDNSAALLDKARASLPDAILEERDIVEHPPDAGAYDLVVLFGVLHHLPGADRRLAFMRTLAERVAPGGWLVFTAWRFYEYPRFRDRVVPWEADLQVEAHDYLLDWRRGERALRYCHYVDDAEAERLITATGLERVAQYRADGFTGDVNLYVVLKKPNSKPT
ncbi:MAG: class I SAM-dependent methyltransferase [Chloroflexi bacterium]|uniref:class I SAM-dependent methyltransferase n=1 Tax=Candidatus Flexifilum breve TaxID=3140694 RepID=UPI0031370F37|nr:class I SAM-dependent methyltransferase [Chloroflexota bacterium]